MHRIVRFYETGGPEVLRVEDADQHPRKGEVLLQVEAIGLNRADSMFMHGRFYEKTRLPASPGFRTGRPSAHPGRASRLGPIARILHPQAR